MPLTFLSHQAVVLPFKLAAPRWFSGTALVLGSIAPDVEYFLRGYPTAVVSHTWPGQFTFCLPVTVALHVVTSRVIAEPAAAHLPDGGEYRLRDYALIREQPATLRHWAIVAVSALVGSSSHVLLDRFADRLGGMPYHVLQPTAAVVAANIGLWIALALITVRLLQHIGRHALLRRWRAGSAGGALATVRAEAPREATGRNPWRWPSSSAAFWGFVIACTIAGGALGALYRRSGFFMHQPATWVHIWLCSVSGGFLGLLAASAAWHVRRSRLVQHRGGQQ